MLDGLAILIVEDEQLLAMDLAFAVEDRGGVVVGPVASVAEGIAILAARQTGCGAQDGPPMLAAVLDANLIDRDVTPLALRLIECGIPFVIHSAIGLPEALAASHPDLPLVRKPARPAVVLGALDAAIARAASQPRQRPAGCA